MKRDIVYIIKPGSRADELRYSLRSVTRFFPYRKIIIIGGCPEGIAPDLFIPDEQPGKTKWEKSTHSLRLALEHPEITDEFFLFNDDFFILRPIESENFVNFTAGTLEHRVNEIIRNAGGVSAYANRMSKQRIFLRAHGYDTLNFALHLPFLVDKNKARELFEKYPKTQMFRSTYANFAKLPYAYHPDVKIRDYETTPDDAWDFVSTSDDAWEDGEIGLWIKEKFPRPSVYEKDVMIEKLSQQAKELYTEDGDEIYE